MSTIIPNVTIRAAKVTVFSSMPQMKNIPKDMKIVIGIVDAATEATRKGMRSMTIKMTANIAINNSFKNVVTESLTT